MNRKGKSSKCLRPLERKISEIDLKDNSYEDRVLELKFKALEHQRKYITRKISGEQHRFFAEYNHKLERSQVKLEKLHQTVSKNVEQFSSTSFSDPLCREHQGIQKQNREPTSNYYSPSDCRNVNRIQGCDFYFAMRRKSLSAPDLSVLQFEEDEAKEKKQPFQTGTKQKTRRKTTNSEPITYPASKQPNLMTRCLRQTLTRSNGSLSTEGTSKEFVLPRSLSSSSQDFGCRREFCAPSTGISFQNKLYDLNGAGSNDNSHKNKDILPEIIWTGGGKSRRNKYSKNELLRIAKKERSMELWKTAFKLAKRKAQISFVTSLKPLSNNIKPTNSTDSAKCMEDPRLLGLFEALTCKDESE